MNLYHSRLSSYYVAFPVMGTVVFRCHPRERVMKLEMAMFPGRRDVMTAGWKLGE